MLSETLKVRQQAEQRKVQYLEQSRRGYLCGRPPQARWCSIAKRVAVLREVTPSLL